MRPRSLICTSVVEFPFSRNIFEQARPLTINDNITAAQITQESFNNNQHNERLTWIILEVFSVTAD